eukprot:SAG31_NODE_1446_length_8318_cov_8.573914_2_plen_59_part_00
MITRGRAPGQFGPLLALPLGLAARLVEDLRRRQRHTDEGAGLDWGVSLAGTSHTGSQD